MAPLISVVIPVFGCCENLKELCARLDSSLSSISEQYEIIMVNDASPDASWEVIQVLAHGDKRIRGINLSKNFGQHYAITAGLDHACGDWISVMDCDLQDSPEEIPKLYYKAREGYDIVVGRRTQRRDSFLKKASSRVFYYVFNYFTGAKVDRNIGNFGIYSRKVIRSISKLREHNRSFGLFVAMVGFQRIEIDINHAGRPLGKSSYTLNRRMRLAFDSIVAHSNKLLWIFVKLGILLSVLSIIYSFYLVVAYFVLGTPVAGWTSLMVSVYFTAGLIIGCIGIVGLYVGKVFDEVKGRPLYIIESTTFEIETDHG